MWKKRNTDVCKWPVCVVPNILHNLFQIRSILNDHLHIYSPIVFTKYCELKNRWAANEHPTRMHENMLGKNNFGARINDPPYIIENYFERCFYIIPLTKNIRNWNSDSHWSNGPRNPVDSPCILSQELLEIYSKAYFPDCKKLRGYYLHLSTDR